MVDFSDPHLNSNYSSSAEPNEAGLQILYDITNIFLDAVVKGSKLLPDGFMDQFNDLSDFIENFSHEVSENAMDIVEANTAIIATVGVGLFLTLLMPIIGIIFCCCHWGGNCGGKREAAKKKDGQNRILCAIIFLILIVAATIGCAWFFLGNVQAKKGTEEIPQAMKNLINDDELFINNTKLEFNYLLNVNFKEAEYTFGTILDEAAVIEIPELTNKIIIGTNLDAITSISKMIINLTDIYNTAEVELGRIRGPVHMIDKTLRNIADDLNSCKITLKCVQDICQIRPNCTEICDQLDQIIGVIKGVDIGTIVNDIPDLNPLESGVIDPVLTILDMAYDKIDDVTAAFVDEYFQDMLNQVAEIGGELLTQGESINEMLDTLTIPALLEMTTDQLDEEIDNIEVFINDYYPIFDYTLIAFGSIIVAMLAVFVISLAMGSWTSTSNQTTQCASRLICVTLGLFFFFAIFLFLVATIFFIVGAVGEKFVCRTLGEPEEAKIIKLINPLFNKTLNDAMSDIAGKDVNIDWNIVSMIIEIRNGSPIYNVFHLEYIYDINELADWQTTYDINILINKAKNGIDETILTAVTEMDNVDIHKQNVMKMAEAFDMFVPTLNNITGVSLEEHMYIDEIKQAILNMTEIIDEIPEEDEDLKKQLKDIQKNIEGIIINLNHVNISWSILEDGMEEVLIMLNNEMPTNMVTNIFDGVTKAKEYISGEGKQLVLDVFDETIEDVLGVIDDYVDHGISTVNNNLGAMTPVSQMWNFADASLCQNILDPFNSVWSGLGLTLLFILLPLSIVSCSLMSIYGRAPEELALPIQFQKGNMKTNPRNEATVNQKVHYSVPDHYKPRLEVHPTVPGRQIHYSVPDHYKPSQQVHSVLPGQQGHYAIPDHYNPSQQAPNTVPGQHRHYSIPDHHKPSQQDHSTHSAVPDHFKSRAPHRYEVPSYYKPNQEKVW